MVSATFIIACIASLAAAPQNYGSFAAPAVSSTYTPITAPKGAAQWGNTSSSQSSSGNTSTYDNETHSGTANNFGQEITNYGSQGTNYNNQAATSNTVGGSQTQYSSATSTPSYGSSYDGTPSTSGQSSTVGGQTNQFTNSASSGSNVTGGFVTQGVKGSSYNNNQVSNGGSSTQTQSSFANSANSGSSWNIPASYGYGSTPAY